MDHIGYDLEGMPVARPKGEDAIDRFLALNETSGGWKTIYDEKTGKRTKISARDMEIIKQLRSGEANSRYDSEKVRLSSLMAFLKKRYFDEVVDILTKS